MSVRLLSRLAAVAACVALCATACDRADRPVPVSKGGDGTLRLSYPGEPRSLNPNAAPLDEYALFIAQNLFSKLVSLCDDGTVLPDLAERWEESPDGLAYTFHLRRDATWHDGKSVTADDVRATFAQIAHSPNGALAARVEGAEAIDAATVRIRLKAPWAAFITNVAWYGAFILPAHAFPAADGKTTPIGSGPFKFASWAPGRLITLAANRAYYGQGPYVDAVEYHLVKDQEQAVALLLDGKVDFMFGRPPHARVAELSRADGIRVRTAPSDARTYLAFNMRRRPFADLRARRAVSMAIDRRAIVDKVLSGFGTPSSGFYVPMVSWAYNGEARVPAHDRAAAARLLAQVIPPGTHVTFTAPGRSGASPLANELAAQLAAIGLVLDVRIFPPDEYRRPVFVDRDFDIALMSGSQGPDPDAMASRFASDGAMQVMGYSNRELDHALAAAGRQTDPIVRAAAYQKAQRLLAEDLPIVPLYEIVDIVAFRDGLRGVPQDDARGLVPFHTYNLVRLPGAR